MAGLQMLNLLVNGRMLWETREQILTRRPQANFAAATFPRIHLNHSLWFPIPSDEE